MAVVRSILHIDFNEKLSCDCDSRSYCMQKLAC